MRRVLQAFWLPAANLLCRGSGIQESEWFDIHIPLKFGIPQNTGDTVGPGGIFRGLRTVPVIWDILKDIIQDDQRAGDVPGIDRYAWSSSGSMMGM
jgi:hypothetical protein